MSMRTTSGQIPYLSTWFGADHKPPRGFESFFPKGKGGKEGTDDSNAAGSDGSGRQWPRGFQARQWPRGSKAAMDARGIHMGK